MEELSLLSSRILQGMLDTNRCRMVVLSVLRIVAIRASQVAWFTEVGVVPCLVVGAQPLPIVVQLT